jgi:hypothetical protein
MQVLSRLQNISFDENTRDEKDFMQNSFLQMIKCENSWIIKREEPKMIAKVNLF